MAIRLNFGGVNIVKPGYGTGIVRKWIHHQPPPVINFVSLLAKTGNIEAQRCFK